MNKNLILIVALFLTVWLSFFQTNAVAGKSDILFVLDNSGSMKAKDPDFLTRKVVGDLVNGISKESQIGLILFADKVDSVLPLTPLEDSNLDKKVTNALARLSYQGKYTNIPSAIEKAIYDLKTNGRKDTQKLIVFMTDGFIDTGDIRKDDDLKKWLKDNLTEEARNAKIRIYSVAFSEEADFEIIQTLGLKTDGGYYRAITKAELQSVFNTILEEINISRPERQVTASIGETPQEKNIPRAISILETIKETISNNMFTTAIAVFLFLGIVIITKTSNKKEKKISETRPEPVKVVTETEPVLPVSILEDVESVTGGKEIRLTKSETTIGRETVSGGSSVDIAIPKDTVSALHATIEYRDTGFYIIDHHSTNHTFLNQQMLSADVAHRMKSGDVVSFDKYRFRLVIQKQTTTNGMVHRPAEAGGTRIRTEGLPIQNLHQPEPKAVFNGKIVDKDDKEGTLVKTKCPNHSSHDATEFCPVCKKAFCKVCMMEKEGKTTCRVCA